MTSPKVKSTSGMQRILSWQGCYNVRDVGGYVTSTAHQLRWRVLLRADDLVRLKDEGFTSVIEARVNTIIDLRTPKELTLAPHPFASPNPKQPIPKYINLSLFDETNLEAVEALSKVRTLAGSYLIMLEQFGERIVAIIEAIAEALPGTVVVHCHSGKDRTGLIIALILELLSVPRSVILEDYSASEEQLRPLYERVRRHVLDDEEKLARITSVMTAPSSELEEIFYYLDREYDGPVFYLRQKGLTNQAIEKFLQHLIAPRS